MRLFAHWNPLTRIWQHKKLVAITVGVVLAVAPLIAFDFWLSDLVERQSQEDASNLAKRAITLADTRVGKAISALNELAEKGVDSCDPAHMSLMQQTVFAVAPIKEIVLVDAGNRVMCSNSTISVGERKVLSSEWLADKEKVFLDVVSIQPGSEQVVRIRRPVGAGSDSLAALIPAELFLPMAMSQGGTFSAYARINTRAGDLLVETSELENEGNGDGSFVGRAQSELYGINALIAIPKGGKNSLFRDLSRLSLFIPGVLAVLLMAVAALLPRRQPSNPVADLQHAIEAGEFVPYYQPVVDIRSGRLLGAEVLARWKKPDGTLVMPASFIPLAESSGLITKLTYHLMRRACVDVGPVIGRRPGFKIAFNFTAQLFGSATIVRDVRKIFTSSPISLSQVVFELTEREPIDDLTEIRQAIAALQGIGARIAIDDVGTGHSGLSYMLKLGVDIIKIDKMFVDAIGTDRKSNTIVETLVDLARNMRMDIIAEGVETFEQVVHLRELGIRAAQGYVFAPPLPASAFLQLVEAIDPLPAADPALAAPGKGHRYIPARPRVAADGPPLIVPN